MYSGEYQTRTVLYVENLSVSDLLRNMALEQDRETRDFGLPEMSSPLLVNVGIAHTVESTFWAQ